jgi:hypothetical protein
LLSLLTHAFTAPFSFPDGTDSKSFFANGDRCEYRFDQRHGRGIYSGAMAAPTTASEDKRHGHGKFSWPDGALYEGEFRNGVREGHGSYLFSDGRYTGS